MSPSRRVFLTLYTSSVVASILPNVEAAKKKRRKRKKQRRCKGLSTALSIIQALQRDGQPIGAYEDYNLYTDPNGLMGRTGGYTSKVNFQDTRLERLETADFAVSDGGSVEFFTSSKDLQARVQYLDHLQQTDPDFEIEWMFIRGTALLRLSHRLQIAEGDAYEISFLALRVCS